MTWRVGVAATIRGGPFGGWPAVIREVHDDRLRVEVVLTGDSFDVETSGLTPHDFDPEPGKTEKRLLARIFGKHSSVPYPEVEPPKYQPRLDRSTLLQGVRLAHCQLAVCAARWPDSSGDANLWTGDQSVYKSADGSGNLFTVAWDDAGLIAVLFDHESDRSPFNDHEPRDPMEVLELQLPSDLIGLARRALYPMVLDSSYAVLPMITTWLWSDGDELRSEDPWPEFFRHGGHLVEKHLLSVEQAMRGPHGWQVQSSLTEAQAALALELAAGKKDLDEDDRQILLTRADPQRGEACCCRILNQLGVRW